MPSPKLLPDSGAESFEPYAPEPEIHLRDYWYVVLRRRWLITAVALTVTALASVRALLQSPQYSATSVLNIGRGRVDLTQNVIVRESWLSEFYPTQERVLGSRTLALRVVDQLQLWKHPLLGAASSPEPTTERRDDLAGRVHSMLSISHVANTQLMELKFTTADPKLSAQLANALAYQYIAYSMESETDLARNTAAFFREQIEKLQSDIQQKERLLQDLSQQQDILLVDQRESMVLQQLDGLNAQWTQARAARLEAEARHRSFEGADPATLPEVANSPSVSALKTERARVEKQLAEMSSKFKPDWPEMQRLESALEELEERIQKESEQTAREVVATAARNYRSARDRERLLQQAVDEQKQQAQEINRTTADYNRIQVELENQRNMLQQLLRRHSETGLSAELGERQPVNVRIVEEAVVPRRPSEPNLRTSVLLGLLLGVSLAFGLAFFLDYWDTTIHTMEDLQRYVALPYLGMVPRYSTDPLSLANGNKLRLLPAETSPHRWFRPPVKDLSRTRSALASGGRDSPSGSGPSLVSERFKFLRGSLLLSIPGAPPKTVLITGPDKNAGKTFVACNLAASLGELNKKVLLVDADLRNPQLHRVFRYRNRVGLSSVLTGQAKVEAGTVFSTSLPNVFVMLGGPVCPSPAELLGSKQMDEFLGLVSQHFDHVLLDSAPLLPVFDSHVLTAKCDAALLVVRSGYTSRYAVSTATDLIERVGGKITGVVLNDVDLADMAQNYYYSYHTYEYGAYPSESAEPRG